MESIESRQDVSKKSYLKAEVRFGRDNKFNNNKNDPLYKRRVRLGGISKQTRRNEPIGIIGELRLYILEEDQSKEIVWLKTSGPSKEAKEKLASKGYRILATYYADDKGEIKLPKGIHEREVVLSLD